jgi:hypothetical protein
MYSYLHLKKNYEWGAMIIKHFKIPESRLIKESFQENNSISNCKLLNAANSVT